MYIYNIYIYILLSPLLGVFIWFNPPSLRMARGGLNMSFEPNRYRTHTHTCIVQTTVCVIYIFIYIYISLNFIFTIHIYIVTLVFFLNTHHCFLFFITLPSR